MIRGDITDEVFDLWKMPLGNQCYAGLAQRICEGFGLSKTYLRHARLYAFEELPVDGRSVVVHATGNTVKSMPDHVVDQISKNYKSHTIYQIGGMLDRETPFIDRRGMPLWDSIKLIATSGTFIGVDSGMMNVANCYPRIRKKVVLLCDFGNVLPVAHPIRWIDFNWEYFNPTVDDMGISMSYVKI